MATLGIFTLSHDTARKRAVDAITKAPHGARVKISEPARTLDQNALLWPILNEVALAVPHGGAHRTPEEWKGLFMHACGKEVSFLPALDGKGFVPFGMSSSKLSKREFSDLLEFIFAWCAENGVALKMREAA
ncbi:MAG: recombination protein NinB [Xanthomonadaceae bacterium]|nr:recombination protein NinB [Xanthomonadaceae bacterium]